jgi:hypothetical protein
MDLQPVQPKMGYGIKDSLFSYEKVGLVYSFLKGLI